MIGALWTGISGLAAEQTALDNEAHNIANVNTIGYKASRISFADQMYQDKIGKGAKVLDAEKLFKQGGFKLTGVAYDMALKGDGFFSVSNKSANGTIETFYTRAGNFRMGDNGTLQDSAGNEVQGWAMFPIDNKSDVRSSNQNVKVFTGDYTQTITSKIIHHGKYIESYTTKATDYSKTAESDSTSVFTGAGQKNKSVKVKDIEELIKDYTSWINKIQETPDGSSVSSIAQVSQINFKGESFKTDGDQIYVYINGDKIEQKFISVVADPALITPAMVGDLDGDGEVTTDDANLAASRIATYKGLADKISNKAGFEAYVVGDGNTGNDMFNSTDIFEKISKISTKTPDDDVKELLKGMIEIKSLIPGKAFTITEVAETGGSNNVVYGTFNETSSAISSVTGSGTGALESSRESLVNAIVGKQRDVYASSQELSEVNGIIDYTYQLTIYDKDTEKNIVVPSNPLNITNPEEIDDFVTAINNNFALSGHIVAKNINNNLVITSLDKNADVEFSGSLSANSTNFVTEEYASTTASDTNNPEVGQFTIVTPIDRTKTYSFSIEINGAMKNVSIPSPAGGIADIATAIEGLAGIDNVEVTGSVMEITGANDNEALGNLKLTSSAPSNLTKNSDYSGRDGAGAEFIEIITMIDQTASLNSLQLRLDTLKISDSAFGEFKVDSSGLITMKQDGAEIAIGQVAIALFNNQRGLDPRGDNLFAKTHTSGSAIYNVNNDKTASISGKTLELSTADLSESLVNLMVFQRAFEANAKSITTADQLLNTLINLKR